MMTEYGHEMQKAIEQATAALVAEVDRLTAYLHRIQQHPDYKYSSTFVETHADLREAGYEINPYVDCLVGRGAVSYMKRVKP